MRGSPGDRMDHLLVAEVVDEWLVGVKGRLGVEAPLDPLDGEELLLVQDHILAELFVKDGPPGVVKILKFGKSWKF